MTELFAAGCVFLAGLAVIALGVAIVYAYGGERVRDQIKSEW